MNKLFNLIGKTIISKIDKKISYVEGIYGYKYKSYSNKNNEPKLYRIMNDNNVCIFSGTENDIFKKLENYIILD